MALSQENLPVFVEKLEAYCQEQGREMFEVFEISAWQAKGLQSLLLRTHDLVENAEFVPMEEEMTELAHYTLEEEAPFEVTEIEPGYWQITGAKIEKLYAMTNMSHDESIARFARQMRAMGIDDALREKGAQSGDLVELSGYQFEFMD